MYIHTYDHIYIHLSLSLYIYIYIYIYLGVLLCTCLTRKKTDEPFAPLSSLGSSQRGVYSKGGFSNLCVSLLQL